MKLRKGYRVACIDISRLTLKVDFEKLRSRNDIFKHIENYFVKDFFSKKLLLRFALSKISFTSIAGWEQGRDRN